MIHDHLCPSKHMTTTTVSWCFCSMIAAIREDERTAMGQDLAEGIVLAEIVAYRQGRLDAAQAIETAALKSNDAPSSGWVSTATAVEAAIGEVDHDA